MILYTMKKLVVSLTDETDEVLRQFIREQYSNRRGALSIVVEEAILDFLRGNGMDVFSNRS